MRVFSGGFQAARLQVTVLAEVAQVFISEMVTWVLNTRTVVEAEWPSFQVGICCVSGLSVSQKGFEGWSVFLAKLWSTYKCDCSNQSLASI